MVNINKLTIKNQIILVTIIVLLINSYGCRSIQIENNLPKVITFSNEDRERFYQADIENDNRTKEAIYIKYGLPKEGPPPGILVIGNEKRW